MQRYNRIQKHYLRGELDPIESCLEEELELAEEPTESPSPPLFWEILDTPQWPTKKSLINQTTFKSSLCSVQFRLFKDIPKPKLINKCPYDASKFKVQNFFNVRISLLIQHTTRTVEMHTEVSCHIIFHCSTRSLTNVIVKVNACSKSLWLMGTIFITLFTG